MKSQLSHSAAAIDPVLQDALDVLSEGMAVFDADARLLMCNERYAQVWDKWGAPVSAGVSFADLIRAGIAAGRYPDASKDPEAWIANRIQMHLTREVEDLRIEFGEHLKFRSRPTPSGGFVTTCLDVTDLRAREARAVAAQGFLDSVVENMPAILIVKDGETGEFLLVNHFFEDACGVTRTDVLGKTDGDLFPPDQAKYFTDYDRKVMASEDVWTIEEEPLDTPHNGRRWLQTRKVAVPFGDGRRNLLTICQDITDSKAATEALAGALQRAESASVAKSEFLANMSHEIRTPLNGVIGMAEVVSRTSLTVDQREMVQTIINSGRTLNLLLSDILDLSKIEAGAVELCEEPLDVRSAITNAVSVFEAVAGGKDIDFNVIFEPGFHDHVVADGLRIRQIVANLTSNAVKFTAKGGVTIRAATRRAPDDRLILTVAVSDTGEGFDAAVGDSLFERFQQADGTVTRRVGGTGLGLPIARRFARLMGGDIAWQSKKGAGATFTFEANLPISHAVAPNEPAPDGSDEAAATTDSDQPRLRVLLAEDHPINQKVVLLMLSNAADVTAVSDGQAALDAMQTQVFDIVLMDSQMPIMDGLTAIRAIREREARLPIARTPIVSLTANAMPHQVSECLAAGADLHLAKPVSMQGLFGVIEAALELSADAVVQARVG